MNDHFADLAGILARVKSLLDRAETDPSSSARLLPMATSDSTGQPDLRTLVLRGWDARAMTLDVHTDANSSKVTQLRANPRAVFLIWDAPTQQQFRIKTDVEIRVGAAVADHWARVPISSRKGYGVVPSPGQPITESLAYDRPADPDCFAVVRCVATEIEALQIGPPHRRARFVKSDGWAGQWLAP